MSILDRRRRNAAGTLETPPPPAAKRKLAPYPEPPPKRLTGMAATRYAREIAASVRDRTCPLLITKAEAKAALWVQRLPESLVPVSFSVGNAKERELYRAEDVRRHLLDPDLASRGLKPSDQDLEKVASGDAIKTAGLNEAHFSGGAEPSLTETPIILPGTAGMASADGLAVLAWQFSDPDPVRRQIAAEAAAAHEDFVQRGCPAAPLPIPEFARRGPPTNPDPKKLRRDPDKQAFRFITVPTERCVDCGGRTSFGVKIECGLCDGRAEPARRFQPGVWVSCCYCGVGGVGAPHICDRCKELKQRAIAAGITADDRILLYIQKALKEEDFRQQAERNAEEDRRRRERNRQQTERRWQQGRSGRKTAAFEPEDEFAEAAE